MLFVGTKIATLGPEDDMAVALSIEEILRLVPDTADRLRSADFSGNVGLYLEWLIDA